MLVVLANCLGRVVQFLKVFRVVVTMSSMPHGRLRTCFGTARDVGVSTCCVLLSAALVSCGSCCSGGMLLEACQRCFREP